MSKLKQSIIGTTHLFDRHPLLVEELEEILLAADKVSLKKGYRHRICSVVGDIAVVIEKEPSFKGCAFTFLVKSESHGGRWVRSGAYVNSEEQALLSGLGLKYGGPNSQFGSFAGRMLFDA